MVRVRVARTETMVPSSSGRRASILILGFTSLFSLVTWQYALSFGTYYNRPTHCWDVRKCHFSSWRQPRGYEAGRPLDLRKIRESRMRTSPLYGKFCSRWESQVGRITTIGRHRCTSNLMVESKEDGWFQDIEKETREGTPLKHLVLQAGPEKVQKLTVYLIPLAGVIGMVAGMPGGAVVSCLGAGLGSALGAVMRTQLLEECKAGASLSLAKLLEEHGPMQMTASEVSTVLAPYRLTDSERMGVVCSLYSRYLFSMCSQVETKPSELKELQSLCEILDLEGLLLGEAHYDACSRLYKNKILFASPDELNGGSDINRRCISKFLFLTQRTLTIQDTEEAAMYEVSRLRKILDITEDEQAYRVNEVARPLYEKAVATALSKLGLVPAASLKKAADTLGLPEANAQAVHFNIIYQEIARVTKGSDGGNHLGQRNQPLSISPDSKERLKQLAQLFSIPFSHIESALQKYTVPVFEEKMEEELRTLMGVIENGGNAVKAAMHFQQVMAAMSVNLNLPGGRAEAELEQMFKENSIKLFMLAFQMSKVGAVDQMMQATHKALKFVSSLLPVIEDQIGVKKGEGLPILVKKGDSILKGSGTTRAERVKMFELFTKGIEEHGVMPNELGNHQEMTKLLASLLGISETEVHGIKSNTVGPQLTEAIELAIMSEEFSEESKKNLLGLKSHLDIPDKLYEEACKEIYKNHVQKYVEENRNRKAILSPFQAKTLSGIAGLFDLPPTYVSTIHKKEFGNVFEQSILESFETPGGLRDPVISKALSHLKERLSILDEDAAEMIASASKKKLAPLVSQLLHDFDRTVIDEKNPPPVRGNHAVDAGEDYFSHGGAASGNLGIEVSAADKAVSTDILAIIDFYERNGLMDLHPDGDNITVNATIGDIVKGEENLKKLYTHFLTQSFAAPPQLVNRFQSSQSKLAAILGLSSEVTTKIAGEMASTLVRKLLHENMKAEPPRPLGDHEHKMLAQLRLKLGLSEENFQSLLSRTTKGLIAMAAERARSSGEVSQSARRLRTLCSTFGVDMELDLGMTLNQRKGLLEAEIKEAVENAESPENIERNHLPEIAEELSLPAEDAAECVEKVVMEGSSRMLISAGMDMIRGIETRAILAIESLLKYLRLTGEGVEVETGIDVTPTQKLAVYNLYKNAKLHSNLSTAEIAQINHDLHLLMKALALQMETATGD